MVVAPYPAVDARMGCSRESRWPGRKGSRRSACSASASSCQGDRSVWRAPVDRTGDSGGRAGGRGPVSNWTEVTGSPSKRSRFARSRSALFPNDLRVAAIGSTRGHQRLAHFHREESPTPRTWSFGHLAFPAIRSPKESRMRRNGLRARPMSRYWRKQKGAAVPHQRADSAATGSDRRWITLRRPPCA